MDERAAKHEAPSTASSLKPTEKTATIRLDAVHKTYDLGEFQVQALRGISLKLPRRICGHHGRVGLRQIHIDEHPGMSGQADKGQYFLDGKDVSGLTKEELARFAAVRSGSSFSNSTCCRARRRSKTSSSRRFTPAYPSKSARARRPRWNVLGFRTAPAISPRSFPAVNSSAWPSRERWSIIRRCYWPTSPPATWTAAPASKSWISSRS